ncbi:MAG: hypothetical protein FWE35_10825 [Streptosporangiales bacterium]|nr:hypothetical protein [Streptosporangiales bacterium]
MTEQPDIEPAAPGNDEDGWDHAHPAGGDPGDEAPDEHQDQEEEPT